MPREWPGGGARGLGIPPMGSTPLLGTGEAVGDRDCAPPTSQTWSFCLGTWASCALERNGGCCIWVSYGSCVQHLGHGGWDSYGCAKENVSTARNVPGGSKHGDVSQRFCATSERHDFTNVYQSDGDAGEHVAPSLELVLCARRWERPPPRWAVCGTSAPVSSAEPLLWHLSAPERSCSQSVCSKTCPTTGLPCHFGVGKVTLNSARGMTQ